MQIYTKPRANGEYGGGGIDTGAYKRYKSVSKIKSYVIVIEHELAVMSKELGENDCCTIETYIKHIKRMLDIISEEANKIDEEPRDRDIISDKRGC